MVITRKKETVLLIFSYCVLILKTKLDNHLQMRFSSKSVYVISWIASITIFYYEDNLWLCKKYLYSLAKQVGLSIKKVFPRDLDMYLRDI